MLAQNKYLRSTHFYDWYWYCYYHKLKEYREYLYEEFTVRIKTVVLFLKILIQDNTNTWINVQSNNAYV